MKNARYSASMRTGTCPRRTPTISNPLPFQGQGSQAMMFAAAAVVCALARAGSTVELHGLSCPAGCGERQNQVYLNQGTTLDGRPWFQGMLLPAR